MARLNDCPICASEPDLFDCGPAGAPPVVALLVWPRMIREGDWCDTCHLPSVTVAEIVSGCGHGWPVGVLGLTAYCEEHRETVPVPPAARP